jgi:tetratricopeptide (TPR) repeat protein
MQSGHAAEALTYLTSAYELCPADYANTRDLASAEIANGDWEEARPLVNSLLEQRDAAELHSLLGEIEASEKNYKAAAMQYQAAAKMDASEQNVFDFGTSLMKLDYSAATTILRYGVKSFPKSIKLYVALATALYVQGQSEEGARLLCNASDLDPLDRHPMEFLAETEFIPPSVLPDAIRHLANLHRRYPDDGLILFDYAMAKSQRWSSDPEASPPSDFASELNSALKLNPHIAEAYFQMSTLHNKDGRPGDEIRALKKAVEVDPQQEKYHFRLAYAYKRIGDQAGFQRELKTFEDLHSSHASLW